MDYGFVLKVTDLTSAQMKQIENNIRSMGATVQTETNNMQDNFGKLGNAANDLKNMLIEAFAIREIYEFGKELLNITTEFQTFTNVIKYSSDGIVDNAQNVDYLNNAIVRLHLPMQQAYQQFSEMQAGMVGTGIEGEKLRKIFEGVAEAATVMHLDPDRFSRTTYALKEIGELGTVQMRQMRMLAIALPGAMSIAAKSMGMTSEQFHKAMKGGQINSADFLPKFATGLTQRFEGGLANAGKSLMSQINDEKNSILKLMLDMGNTLQPLFLDILTTVKNAMEGIRSAWNSLTGNSSFVDALKEIFDWAVKLVPIWVAYEIVMKAITVTTDLFISSSETLAALMGTEATATEAATAAWEGFNAALETSIIGGLVATLGLMLEHFRSINHQIDLLIDKKFNLSASNAFFNSQKGIASQVQEQATVLDKLSPEGRQNLANDIARNHKMAVDSMAVISKRDSSLQQEASIQHPTGAWKRFLNGGIPTLWQKSDGGQKIIDSAATSKIHILEWKEGIQSMNKIGDVLAKKYHVKPDLSIINPQSGLKESAINTSNLSGASGGLGQARIIQIHIDTFQKNEGVKESRDKADSAIEKLTELLNGFSDSINSQ